MKAQLHACNNPSSQIRGYSASSGSAIRSNTTYRAFLYWVFSCCNYIKNLWFQIFAYIYILNHPSSVVALLTKMCRPVGCCPVRLSPSCLSPSWFVAQMTEYRVYCPIVARQLCSVQCTILQLLPYLTLPVVNLFWLAWVFLAEVRCMDMNAVIRG